MRFWNKFKYKYLSAFLASVVMAVFLAENQGFHDFLLQLGALEYLGVYLAGLLFVSSFTVPIAAVLIVVLSENIHPLVLGLVGGVGAVTGDLLIFKFVKDHLTDELSLLFGKEGTSYVKHVFKSKYIAWTLPIIGAFIIASPLPDELGVSLLGLSNISQTKFLVISYLSNVFGILAIAAVAKIF